MKPTNSQAFVRPIRLRLFRLLLAALAVVVLLVVVSLLGSTFFFINRISNPSPPPRSGLATVLEAYYEGRGSWQGVEILLKAEPPGQREMGRSEWTDSILLDADGRILLDQGRSDTARTGTIYQMSPGEIHAPLFGSDHQQIGALVLTNLPSRSNFIGMLLGPLGATSIFLVILTLVIGFLLSERLINPLAEVIAASRAVASGVLSTRVKVRGPDDLRMLSDSFNQMAGTLEKNDREQRDLITDIAHELRTPLSILQGKLEGIVDGIYPASKEQLAPVLEETYLLEKLIEDLDMLAQASAHQLHFSREPFDLGLLARGVATGFEAEAVEKQITLVVNEAPDLPAALGDSQRTGQVISNLVGNALRYTGPGCRVTISLISSPEGAEVRVEDDGPGVPEADLPLIFDRLWRGEKSRSRSLGGAGLGLAIAKQFVEMQGGTIRAENRPEGGLRVSFTLPR
jgi:signal transduction histidine kinase